MSDSPPVSILKRRAPLLKSREFWTETITYVATFISACLGAIWVHKLTYSDLQYPWRVLDSDLSSVYAIGQALGQSWTGSVNEVLGAPFKADLSLVFLFEDLHLVFIRIIAHLTNDPFVAVNGFYILTFGLSAISFLFVALRFSVPRVISVALALSYAWLPYHFSRMDVGHVSLAGYYMLPLGVLVLRRLFDYLSHANEHFFPTSTAKKAALALGVVLIGSSGSYYGLFFSLLTCSLAFLLFPLPFSVRSLQRVSIVVGVAIGFVFAPALRTLIAKSGGLESSVVRSPEESVQFGGSITRLFVPWGTWLPEKLRPAVSIMEYEWNATPLLGALGIWALVIFVGRTISVRDRNSTDSSRSIIYLFIWSLLFYVSGGLGLVFAYGVDPSFRAWNRFSIVILTLSLLAVGIYLTRLRSLATVFSPVLLLLAVSTQLMPLASVGIGSEPDDISKTAYAALKDDAQRVQQAVAPGCSILQLPIMLFPEGVPVGEVGNGEHLWLPLLTRDLRWSYGAGKGTTEGKFWGEYFGASPALPIAKAKELGFCAVVVNFQSFLNRDEIVSLVGQPVFENPITGNSLFLILQ